MQSLFRPKSFNLKALARDQIIENLRDGIIVFDDEDRVVDINPAAQDFFSVADQSVVGKSAAEAFKKFPDLLDHLEDKSPSRAEISVVTATERLYLEVTVSPLTDKSGVPLGYAATIRNVSEWVKLSEETERLMTTDPLTGLLNRGNFLQTGGLEIKRSLRYERPLALLMLDIDLFKKINDEYGHAVGDKVLRTTAASLRDRLRQSDIAGRYGGDEFAILLPEAEKSAALKTAERIRHEVSKIPIRAEDSTFHITVSVGVSALGDVESKTLSDLLNAADAALQRAKNNGRNRVEE